MQKNVQSTTEASEFKVWGMDHGKTILYGLLETSMAHMGSMLVCASIRIHFLHALP